MKTLVVYDSAFGNTEKVAQAIANSNGKPPEARAVLVANAAEADVRAADMVIVGSPTQGGRATAAVQEFIGTLPKDALQGKPVAAFDTRFAMNAHGFGLKMLMKTIGFAAPKIAKALQAKGGSLVTEPEGFIVNDKEGPLADSELERARGWLTNVRGNSL